MRDLCIYGAGGFARELAWALTEHRQAGGGIKPSCFVSDDTDISGSSLNEVPVLNLRDAASRHPGAAILIAVGNPILREQLMSRAAAAGFDTSYSFVFPRVEMSRWVEVGPGSVICAGTILTTNILVGRGVQINLDCTIGHDVIMSDFATLAPGVHVSGNVHIGQRAYVGTGATIINGSESKPLIIGEDAVIGAGACVTRDIAPGITAVGVPAKPR